MTNPVQHSVSVARWRLRSILDAEARVADAGAELGRLKAERDRAAADLRQAEMMAIVQTPHVPAPASPAVIFAQGRLQAFRQQAADAADLQAQARAALGLDDESMYLR